MSKQESGSKVGAALVALGASACCWLPLLLVSLGIGTTGVAAAFDAARPILMVATVLLLGSAFYFTYRKKTACADDGTCAPTGTRRRSKLTLWAITVMAVVSLSYPYWAQHVLNQKNAGADEDALTSADVNMAVEGMTCAACGVTIHDAISALPGVTAVIVDDDPGGVRVWGDVTPEKVAAAIRETGYTPVTNSTTGSNSATAYIEVKGMIQKLGIT